MIKNNKKIFYISIFFSLAFLSIYFFGNSLSGKAPKRVIVPNNILAAKQKPPSMPTTKEQKDFLESIKDSNEKLELLKARAFMLKQRVQKAPQSDAIINYIDTLANIAKTDPKDKDTILELANISFDMKVFSKALDYYEKFLDLEPKNQTIKGKIASCYIFLNKSEKALIILDEILEENEKDFQALAFKTIALSELNRNEEALKYGNLAIENAPDEEGKNRLLKFLKTIETVS